MDIWQRLMESETVRRLQVAFSCATGLPVTLLPASGSGNSTGGAGPLPALFCVEGCMGAASGQLCQRTLFGAERRAARTAQAVRYRCPAGLIKLLMPVMIGGRHAGNLLAGPFCFQSLDAPRLQRLRAQLKRWGLQSQVDALRASWRGSPELTREKLRAVEALLEMFAQYLAENGQRLLLNDAEQRSSLLQKIEAHLAGRGTGAVSVRELAERLHISPCYFCKLFKKQTGPTFTEYRTRLRVEAAKRLLLDPHRRRITEVAFEAGFDCIPYFNRAFCRHVGCSPSEFRARSSPALAPKSR
jgi:AraC-like DNA-binding protein